MLPRLSWIFLDDLSPAHGGDGERILGALLLEEGAREGRLRLYPVRGALQEGWQAFLLRLKEDERVDPALFCCTGQRVVMGAVRSVYPDAPIQISLPHRLLDLGMHLHPQRRGPCVADARRIFSAADRANAVLRFRAWRERWLSRGEAGVRTLEADLAWCLTFYRFPPGVRRSVRTLRLLRLATRAAARAPEPPASAPASTHAVADPELPLPPAVSPPVSAPVSSSVPPPDSPPAEKDQVLVLVDELIADPTFARWLAQHGRDKLRVAQSASAVASAIGLAARILSRGQ